MKTTTCILLYIFTASLALSQSLVTIRSTNPKSGELVTIAYDPRAAGAVHSDVGELFAVAVFWHLDDAPTMREQQMVRSGDQWTTVFAVDDPKAVCISLRFDSEDSIDDNQGAGWTLPMFGKNGKPVKGAQYMQAQLHLQKSYMGFIRRLDTAKSAALLRKEIAAYPDHWRARGLLWTIEMGQSPDAKTKKRIAKEFDAVYAKQRNNEEAVAELLPIFHVTDRPDKAGEIEAAWLKKNPNGIIAEKKAMQEFRFEPDQNKRAALALKYLESFTVRRGMEPMFLSAFLRVKDHHQAAAFLAKYPDVPVNYYNSVGYGLISKGENIARGVAIVKQGIERMPVGEVRTSVDVLTQRRSVWKENLGYQRGMITDSYGEGLMRLGNYAEAETAMEESNRLMEGDDPDNNARLAECYVKNGKNEKAAALSYASLVKGQGNPRLVELYKTAYTALRGSAAGFDSVLNSAEIEMKNVLRAKLNKEMIEQPSVDFELKSIDGSMVKLSNLKGKVVVLDFWATWCGPCLSSFPSLQKIYDRYKDNPDVVILAMNTWERVPPAAREQHVKDFMTKNNYTFPVVFDTDIVQRYGVEGIPTKFILDKNGMVRFKDVGFGGAQEMENKMELQFEMLLNNKSLNVK